MLICFSGIWLHESGVLGASPDGIVTKPPVVAVHYQNSLMTTLMPPTIVEVKCPYSVRDMTVEYAVEHLKDFFIG